ncbi:pyridoxal phosphate-dependent aminotransferase [Peptococcaceae bacterium]|nr:pyridoxal phosphate-dependent aminotransferase [Peptococcaceae bacterium]MCL0052564.1 pyridoxal phosphate-dependent aminotransferase [Peptococcaceae bacterium]MCL0077529.1 pyridoxal phosphate-dependent aminotransferase [Peptococcaceae bacterium]MCL0106299.1 pyridoxal phosphate-dependent aminotransferase [Peptococcaceae bacterium]
MVKLAERVMKISPSLTLAIDAKAKQMKAEGIRVFNFGVGEPDFDTPEHIKQAAIDAINKGMTKYTPAAGTLELKQAVVDKFKRENGLNYDISQIVISCGAKHSLYNAFQVLVEDGDEVILPAPFWVSHLEQIKIAGAEPVIVMTEEKNGFKMTPEQLEKAITSKTKAVLLNSPCNPTGSVYTKEELEALAEVILKHDIIIVSDEIYEKLIYDGLEHVSIASLSDELKECTVVINGVSKAYAMTGWRIGYAAAPVEIAKKMASLQSHATSNPTSIAQAASVAALNGDQKPVGDMKREFVKRRDYMLNRLLNIDGITCPKPGGAFYLFPNVSTYFGKAYKGKQINNATDLATLLLDKVQVAVVPGVAFGSDNFVRLSYATSIEVIAEAMDRIESVLAEIK